MRITNRLIHFAFCASTLFTVAGIAGVESANTELGRGNYSVALKQARPLAEQGDARAQAILGLIYYNGRGVSQDYAQGVAWFRKSAAQGNADAQNELGRAYYFGKGVPQDFVESASWSRKAADQGHSGAELNMGIDYEKGHGVPQDYKEAAAWYLKAALQGRPEAECDLANLYENGLGTAIDDSVAFGWYLKSAEQGYATAQAKLGYFYGTGRGVPRDLVKSVVWNRKAAAQGDGTAQSNLRIAETQLGPREREVLANQRIQEIEARGFKFLTFTDYELDSKSMPRGEKLAIKGVFQTQGQLEVLAESILPDALSVILLTDSAPRPIRKRFIECGRVGAYCEMTVLGHTSTCDVTWLGRHVSTKVCLSVDDSLEFSSAP
jgi:TPR repeat protein